MNFFKNTKEAESKVRKLLQDLEIKTYEIRIEQWENDKNAYFIDIDISNISLYELQCLSQLLNDYNPIVQPNGEKSITIGSVFYLK